MQKVTDPKDLDGYLGIKKEKTEKKSWKPMVFFDDSEKDIILKSFDNSTLKSINDFLRDIILRAVNSKKEK